MWVEGSDRYCCGGGEPRESLDAPEQSEPAPETSPKEETPTSSFGEDLRALVDLLATHQDETLLKNILGVVAAAVATKSAGLDVEISIVAAKRI